jgi:GNAT superfamily N-acetyltransferase
MAGVVVTVYYLEMRARPCGLTVPPREGCVVLQVQRPTVRYYRFLYGAVGSDYHWLSRRKLSDAALAEILARPRNELHVLHVEGSPAGFVEFDRDPAGAVEIVQFGLLPEYIGQGLGKYLLSWAIERAWSYGPSRLWLHTCSLDHPAALPNYRRAGFELYKEETIERPL